MYALIKHCAYALYVWLPYTHWVGFSHAVVLKFDILTLYARSSAAQLVYSNLSQIATLIFILHFPFQMKK